MTLRVNPGHNVQESRPDKERGAKCPKHVANPALNVAIQTDATTDFIVKQIHAAGNEAA
jgi:hypothetical protein